MAGANRPRRCSYRLARPDCDRWASSCPHQSPPPEHKLYLLLAKEKGDAAHSAYNALIRRLVSFERAAACAS